MARRRVYKSCVQARAIVRTVVYTRHVNEPPRLPPKSTRIDLRVAESDLLAFHEAAVRAKLTLSEWIRQRLSAAAVIERETKKR